jgi:hypothetical protein
VKVAQYELLGNETKRHVRPISIRDDRTLGFWFRTRLSDCQHSSIVPFLLRRPDYGGQAGTDSSLKTLTQPESVRGWATFVRSLPRKSFGACGTDFL